MNGSYSPDSVHPSSLIVHPFSRLVYYNDFYEKKPLDVIPLRCHFSFCGNRFSRSIFKALLRRRIRKSTFDASKSIFRPFRVAGMGTAAPHKRSNFWLRFPSIPGRIHKRSGAIAHWRNGSSKGDFSR